MSGTRPSLFIYVILGLIIGLFAGYASTNGLLGFPTWPGLPGPGVGEKGGRSDSGSQAGAGGSGLYGVPAPPLASRDGGAGASADGFRTAPYTVIIFREENPGCRESLTRSRSAGTELAGLDRAGLERRFPGWIVEDFRPAQVILRRVNNEPCRGEAAYRTISVYNERVVVFAGRPGRIGPMLQDTGIDVSRLLPADREKLARGVVVRGDAEVWQFLEGLEAD